MQNKYSNKNPQSFFKDKRITVMGLGLLGRGIGDVRFLAQCGAHVLVTDLKTKEQLATSIDALQSFQNIRYVLGEHRLQDFKDADMVIKAAGVPLDSPYIAEARKNKIPVEMSTALFARLSPATIVGITGTRGKSTVTHVLYEIVKTVYKGKKQKVYLGGNVKGISTLELLPKVKKGDVVVLELDSWQLQGFGESKISPHVSVFTTFFDDHLNYYKGDKKRYFEDKANIYKYQTRGDVIVAGKQVASKVRPKFSKKIVASEKTIPTTWKLQIPGVHNRYNVGLATAAAQALGIKQSIIKKVTESFKGVPGRLELVSQKNDISFYNDTTATTPDATIVALKALGEHAKHKHIVLIMGGADKGLAMGKLIPELKRYAKVIVCLPGTGTDRLMKDLSFKRLQPMLVSSLKDAVSIARAHAVSGDVVLLSPAFASFGLFANEFDRGEQWNTIVK